MLSRLLSLLIVLGSLSVPALAQAPVGPPLDGGNEEALARAEPADAEAERGAQAWAAAPAAPEYPETARFVTDEQRVGARDGPSLRFPVRVMVETGTQVEYLGERDEYSQVRMADGKELWVATRQLLPEPPARARIGAVEAALTQARARVIELEAQVAALADANASGATERERVAASERAMSDELESIRKAAASTLEIRERNEQLGERVVSMEREMAEVARREAIMASAKEREWLIAGAGVLVAGIVLGLVLPRLRLRRQRSSWGEL